MKTRFFVPLLALPLLLGSTSPTPRVATLAIPGPRRFVKVARDVVDVAGAIDPSLPAGAGLFDDALRVPSFSPENVAALTTRLDADLAALHAMPHTRWPIDTQIDWRWILANAETARRSLVIERMYEHRPAQWLEPVANDLIALETYAPDRPDLPAKVWAQVPGMLAEIDRVCTRPTRRDLVTARKLVDALAQMAHAAGATDAEASLRGWDSHLGALTPDRDFAVIGADNYAWRYQHTLLFPWTPAQLLSKAQADLVAIDAELVNAPPRWQAGEPTPEQAELAAHLDQATLLSLYDGVSEHNREATIAGGWVTIPDTVGPIHARATPEAMIPLTGDGGSMNPPPTFVASNVGYWNVEHVSPTATEAENVETVEVLQAAALNGMGPYSAHEGFPGHHLQLALARLNPDPLRSILPDPAQNEGWGLYAEEVFHAHGGFGDDPRAAATTLRSYRGRVGRVVYDVQIESGRWTPEEGQAWKSGHPADPDEDVLRSINWPTQLVAYYGGKAEIVALREAYRAKLGAAYSDRAFHDAFLAEGSIPVALIRAKLLGEPLP